MQPPSEDLDAGASNAISTSSTELPSARFVWTLRLICSVALGISVYLGWTAFRMGEVFGCSGGEVFDCGHVLTSHWSKVFGIPVSIPAAGLYASLLALLAFARIKGPQRLHNMVWGGMTLGAAMAGLAALWFIGLQIFVVEHLCTYCLIVHTCGITLAGVVLISRTCPGSLKLKSVGLSVLGVSALIGIQAATPKADTFEIVRYDDVDPSSGSSSLADVPMAKPDVFSAPDDVFEAPIFEAPLDVTDAPIDVFEAPITADDGPTKSATAETPAARNGNGSNKTESSETKPAVATTLLLIMPPKLLRLTEMLCFAGQSAEETKKPDQETESTENGQESAEDSNAAADTDQSETPEEAAPKVPARRLLTFAGNRFTLDVKQWPILGKPDAKHVFVEMYDYTCPHCRNTHNAITGALKQYGDDLAILALPVPLEAACNPTVTSSSSSHNGACELAKIAVAVWRVDPAKFGEFHDWMFVSPRTGTAARMHAETLVDKERLAKELGSIVPGEYINRHVKLYQKVGSGQVPKLIFPSATLNGEVSSTASLCGTIERELSNVKQ